MEDKKPARREPRHEKNVSPKAEEAKTLLAALDIGSSKICCLIAELSGQGALNVVGVGHHAARGVKSGHIVDLKACETAVAQAIESAEQMAISALQGKPLRSVSMGVPATPISTHHLDVSVRVSGHEVAERDLRIGLGQARSIVTPGRDQLLHVIPNRYDLDTQKGIAEPRGMRGDTLKMGLNAFTVHQSITRNLALVAGANQLEIESFCTTPYAAGLSALVDDERDLGCTVIDMGGGTTSLAVFAEGKLAYATAVPVGGQHVTSDIARGLTTSLADAERIKTLYGGAQMVGGDDTSIIDVPPIGEEEHTIPHYVTRSELTGIIQPRIEETFELIRARLVDSGIGPKTGRRVVLTGGAAQLPGLIPIAELILEKQIRLGRPQKVQGLPDAVSGPAFSAAAGLLIYAAEHHEEVPMAQRSFQLPFGLRPSFLPEHTQKITQWLKENW